MKVPLSWLNEYLDLPNDPQKIADTLTLAGLEVDEIKTIGGDFTGIVVAKVVKSAPMEGSDKLQIAEVFDGTESFQVVCGDPGCCEGLHVAFAKIGAALTDPDGKVWKIRKTKLRGTESFGMLCALDELGLEEKSDGIAKLSKEIPLGTEVASLYQDIVFDLSLTPNLGHCMSVYGVARELSAFLQLPLKPLEISAPKDLPSFAPTLSVEDNALCSKYDALLLDNVKVGPSPASIANKLELMGVRSINNVVDISNYIMLLTGQPLHFFDYEEIAGDEIFVSPLQKEKTFCTLDDEERTLPEGTLLISDAKGPLAIAGVLGGKRGEVSSDTTKVLIESALFHPASIRKTMKALGLKTDASQRFEKGVDGDGQERALLLSSALLQEHAGATPASSLVKAGKAPLQKKVIPCREARVEKLLGKALSLGEIRSLLERLEMTIVKEHANALDVSPPSYRNDICEEIDLIEEVARLYGFNLLPKGKAAHVSSSLGDAPLYLAETAAREALLRGGLQEFSTCDLISEKGASLCKEETDKTTKLLQVLQSKSSDYSILRPSLLPGMLQVVKHNLNNQNKEIAGFEVGRVHFQEHETVQEPAYVGVILSGMSAPHHHDPKPRSIDFFDLKGIAENLLTSFNVQEAKYAVSHLHTFHPGRQARIEVDGTFIGALGEIHPSLLEKVDISQRVYFAEFNLQELMKWQQKAPKVSPLPILPASERDWTLTLPKKVAIASLLDAVQEAAPALLEHVYLLDMFESEKLGSDKKNATLRFVYRDNTKTVDLETVEAKHTKLIQKVAKKLDICIS